MKQCFKNNNELIQSLNTPTHVKRVMSKVDRAIFCLHKDGCYCDKPSPIIMKQTISAPHMHAKAIEYLYPVLKPGSTVLDVGSGSGYLTACFGHLVTVFSPNKNYRGKVVGLEIHKPLVTYSLKRSKEYLDKLFKYPSNYKIIHGSGWDGYPKKSKVETYDAIHVGAATDSIPIHLLHQLKVDGKLVLPLLLGQGHVFCIITKDKDHNIRIEPKESVRYVPLVKKI
jgi:protein-L-isoaspartate(D-aspartate) O-methyltransferase